MKPVSFCLLAVVIGLISMGNIAHAAEIKNMLVNPYFQNGIAGWTLEQHDPFVRGDIMPDSTTKVIGDYSMKMDIRELQAGAETFRAQPKQTGIALEGGKKYTWSFWARAREERELQCQVLVDVWNWRLLGLDQPVIITIEWREYFHTFIATEDYANSRITWLCAHASIDFWIDNVILYEGEYVEGLMADQLMMKPSAVGSRHALTTTWGRAKSRH